MKTYSLSEKAIADLEAICESMSETNRDFAVKFFENVREKCRKVAQFPNMGKNYGEIKVNLRDFVVNNYIVFYFPRSDGIDVVRIISGYRDLESLSI
ncbi:MAG: type II toxin-antitoxin system RelE/ParE family toxin [Symploca sp. SIO1B1]|nr:type II toxin-antitoxin system RelE/ParE family toxin [Symploca sp. SIO1C2]NES01099.1 type II toxin-antitoxin system RelE/ParE family toxin [Symploca sp. SIO1B1]